MTICFGQNARGRAIASTMVLLCASFVSMPVLQICAEEPADKASSLIDGLKNRSPEERWQRVKKQYSVDAAATRKGGPSSANENAAKGLSDTELPPSPDQSSLIPRLPALPVDTSNDWIRPAPGPVALLEELESRAAEQNCEIASQSTPAPGVPTPNDGMKTGPAGDVITGESRPPSERKIGDINPYYDRDRDSDIREFAKVKGREFGLQYKTRVFVNRSFPEIMFHWEPSHQFYHPLYFSDPALERYGHAHHPLIQPIASIARFGTQFVFLPYQMTIDPPMSEEYPLGWYRPGDCAPKLLYQVPLNAEAAVVEASAIAGVYFLIVP